MLLMGKIIQRSFIVLENDMSNLEQILQRIVVLQELPEPEALKRLIDALRVTDEDEDNEIVDAKFDELIALLREHPEYGSGLAAFILRLINKYRQITLYTDTGIASDQSFSSSVSRLISHRFCHYCPKRIRWLSLLIIFLIGIMIGSG